MNEDNFTIFVWNYVSWKEFCNSLEKFFQEIHVHWWFIKEYTKERKKRINMSLVLLWWFVGMNKTRVLEKIIKRNVK